MGRGRGGAEEGARGDAVRETRALYTIGITGASSLGKPARAVKVPGNPKHMKEAHQAVL